MVSYTNKIKFKQTIIIKCLLFDSYCIICQYITMFIFNDIFRSKIFCENSYFKGKNNKKRFLLILFFLYLDSLVTRSIYTFMYRIKSSIFWDLFRSFKSKSTMVKNNKNINYFINLFINLYNNTSKKKFF